MMSGTEQSPLNKKSKLVSMKGHHMALRVPDYESSRRWFVEKLDFRVIQEWPFGELSLGYLAPAGDDAFLIEIVGGVLPGPAPVQVSVNESLQRPGYHHLCLQVDDMEDTLAELRRREVTILGEPFELEAIRRKLAFIADPWGNILELAQAY